MIVFAFTLLPLVQEPALTASGVLAQARTAYSKLSVYNVKGVVTLKGGDLKAQFVVKYHAPGKLRVEWVVTTMPPRRGALILNDGATFWFDSRRDNQIHDTPFADLIKQTSGDSFGSSFHLPTILLKTSPISILDVNESKLTEVITAEGQSMAVIQGTYPGDQSSPCTLWIGLGDGLIYRIETPLAVETHQPLSTVPASESFAIP